MHVPVVIDAEVIVVPSERLLGRRAMSWISGHSPKGVTVRVLVSDGLPAPEREQVARDAAASWRTRGVANDQQGAPESRLVRRSERRGRSSLSSV